MMRDFAKIVVSGFFLIVAAYVGSIPFLKDAENNLIIQQQKKEIDTIKNDFSENSKAELLHKRCRKELVKVTDMLDAKRRELEKYKEKSLNEDVVYKRAIENLKNGTFFPAPDEFMNE